MEVSEIIITFAVDFLKSAFPTVKRFHHFFIQQEQESHHYCMYTKEQLEQMEIPQLMGIVEELDIKVSPDDSQESVIYAILDKAAEQSASGETGSKRKRTRIVKKDTDRVYTVSGKEGENFDVKSRGIKSVEAPSLFSNEQVPEEGAKDAKPAADAEEPKPAPKKRGRKSKAELAAIAAAEAEKKAAEESQQQDVPQAAEESDAVVPEATGNADESADETTPEMLIQLQEKMSQRSQDQSSETPVGVWEEIGRAHV